MDDVLKAELRFRQSLADWFFQVQPHSKFWRLQVASLTSEWPVKHLVYAPMQQAAVHAQSARRHLNELVITFAVKCRHRVQTPHPNA